LNYLSRIKGKMWRFLALLNLLVKLTWAFDVSLAGFGDCRFRVKLIDWNAGVEMEDLAGQVIRENKEMGLWTFHDSGNSSGMTRRWLDMEAPCILQVLWNTGEFPLSFRST